MSNDPMVCFETFAYNTANMAYRRDILKEVGGFREEFYWPGCEDNDLALRILDSGFYMLYLPFHVTHSFPSDLASFFELYFHRGANHYLFMKINREVLERIEPGLSLRDTYKFPILKNHLLYRPHKLLTSARFFSHKIGSIYMKFKLLGGGNLNKI